MPYEPVSPVAPAASSRMWTVGATAAVAVIVLLILALRHPQIAPSLLVGAAVVGGTAWALSARARTPLSVDEDAAPPTETVSTPDAGLLNQAFDALDDPILLISGGEADDIAGRRIVAANRAARDLLRIQRDGGLLVSAVRDPRVLESVDEALFGEIEVTARFESGGAQPRSWRVDTRPLPSGAGQKLALLALHDETDARRIEMMRVDFLANASHELKTPLASLSGFIETLKGHAREDPAARDRFLDIMAIQADRMGRLVADLLSLSRIEMNEHIPPSGRVNLGLVVADVLDAVGLIARERGVRIRVSADPDSVVVGDRDEIVQVAQNLIDNAVKYSPPNGEVEIEVAAGRTAEQAVAARDPSAARLSLLTPDRDTEMRYAVITVRDRGPGLAREHLPRLTERFYRVEGQKSGERSGTGLGLAIVKHIANRHRGGLYVESVQGAGAVFAAYFPMAEMADEAREPASARAA